MMAMASTAEDPRGAGTVGDAANLLRVTNRRTEAEPLFRRALAIIEKSYGPDHPDVATNLSNIASLLLETNRPGEAEPLFRRALAIDEKSYGPDHPDVAERLNNLATLLLATNRLGEAEPLFRRALAITEKSYGSDHPSVPGSRRRSSIVAFNCCESATRMRIPSPGEERSSKSVGSPRPSSRTESSIVSSTPVTRTQMFPI